MSSIPEQNVHSNWKFLIILDACRFDAFENVVGKVGLKGKLDKVWSLSSTTIQWYNENWGGLYPDICLLSSHAYPFTLHTKKTHLRFGESHKLWKKKEEIDINVSLERVREYVTKSSLQRFLVHLVPPHLPFIGERGKQFLAGDKAMAPYDSMTAYGRTHGWGRLIEYYEESLQAALDALKANRDIFKEKTVITSDHGELLGEHGYYLHDFPERPGLTPYPNHPKLHEIPWFYWFLGDEK